MKYSRRWMQGMRPARLLALGALLFPAWVIACNGILGIEERTFDKDAGVTGGLSCESYCDLAMHSCQGDFKIYASNEICMLTCQKLTLGTESDTKVNTVGCRFNQVKLAASTGEVDTYCPFAGPGGGGVCGSNCEGYCQLMIQTCPESFEDEDTCLRECPKVPEKGYYSITVPNEDSIQCRLYHLTSSMQIPEEHCHHADGTTKCPFPPDGGATSSTTAGAGGSGGDTAAATGGSGTGGGGGA